MGKKGEKVSCPPDCYKKKILDDQKSPTPTHPSRVKWSAPKGLYSHWPYTTVNLS